MRRAADLVADVLQQIGVKTIFAMSGNQLMPLFDAIFNHQFQLVHIRHEASAVHMADAWGRLTGAPGVALIPAGPGFANGLSASYSAARAESPLVMISGHSPLSQIGKGGFQEMKQAEIAEYFCKDSRTVEHAEEVGPSLHRAFDLARSGRPGPVHISLPFDLLNTHSDIRVQSTSVEAETNNVSESIAEDVLKHLRRGARPLILAGPHLSFPTQLDLKGSLENTTGVPVVAMESPRGINDPSLGDLATILKEADTVLLLGKTVDFTLQFGSALSEKCKILQLDPDITELQRSEEVFQDRLLVSARTDVSSASKTLVELAGKGTVKEADKGWVQRVHSHLTFRPPQWQSLSDKSDSPIHPVQVCDIVQKGVRDIDEVIFIVDGGEFGQWVQAGLKGGRRVINGPSGAIGACLPFAIAAQLAEPEARVIAFMGDGTAGFHLSEFDTAVRAKAPVTVIIGNDAKWNAEYQIQLRDYGLERTFACELLPTRYDLAAKALGCYGANAESRAELETALKLALESDSPSCINVSLDGKAAPIVRKDESIYPD